MNPCNDLGFFTLILEIAILKFFLSAVLYSLATVAHKGQLFRTNIKLFRTNIELLCTISELFRIIIELFRTNIKLFPTNQVPL